MFFTGQRQVIVIIIAKIKRKTKQQKSFHTGNARTGIELPSLSDRDWSERSKQII